MSAQVHTHNLSELRDILRILWSDPALPAALIVGPPGCGKSTMIAELARDMDMDCEVMMANIREPSDFAGLPVVQGAEVHMLPLEWAKRIAGTRCVLFLDEINTARPATIAALLRVVLDRVVGDVKLGPEVRIVAAMNVAEEAAHGWELPPALANRFYHFQVSETPVSDWRKWAIERSDSPELTTMLKNFGADSLHEAATCGPFASPRSWLAGLRAAAAAQRSGRPELAQHFVASAVGVGNSLAWAESFDTTAVDWSKPQPPAITKKAILRGIAAVKSGALSKPDLWTLLKSAAESNIRATYTTVGSQREYLQQIADTSDAMAVFEYIHKKSQEETK